LHYERKNLRYDLNGSREAEPAVASRLICGMGIKEYNGSANGRLTLVVQQPLVGLSVVRNAKRQDIRFANLALNGWATWTSSLADGVKKEF